MSPEEQIRARLANAMSHLAQELEAQGVDLRIISCVFVVKWENGANSITEPTGVQEVKPRTTTKNNE